MIKAKIAPLIKTLRCLAVISYWLGRRKILKVGERSQQVSIDCVLKQTGVITRSSFLILMTLRLFVIQFVPFKRFLESTDRFPESLSEFRKSLWAEDNERNQKNYN